MPNIEPTVGRIVYFKSRGSLDGVFPPMNFASIITRVWSPTCVNLVTFGDAGLRFETSVNQGEAPGQWDWMPFQKDQQLRVGYDAAKPGAEKTVEQPIPENSAS